MLRKVSEAAASASEQVQAQAKSAVNTATDQAGKYASQAKNSAADEVKGVSSALRSAADDMRSGSPQERTFSQIADSLADVSDTMRDKDLGEMVGAVTDFAKRNPIVFLGSAVMLGFAASRFVKASGSSYSTPPRFQSQDDQVLRATTYDRPVEHDPAMAATYGGTKS